uniref:NADH-ubiquinone oxidoreductase chain 1 n=1 Tax=Serratella sp. Yunnan-2018 TaxID=2748058 RepID=A0A7D6J9Z6_9INSE|nr:NADH dehydrogenase subunit 1 [Serratella sp. Yunnan-2018]QLP88994.1 NADH dehydrogenase subunit 1 [Serratella sp. Yunnan-2018]
MMMRDVVLSMVSSILLVICVLVGVAFLTLLERKVLGYIQIRKGPNKVSFWGIPQPFADAIKLFTKEQTYPVVSNFTPYFISPIFSLFLSLVVWMIFPMWVGMHNFNLGFLFFLSCTSLGVYTVMMAGWSSNSNYALLGGLRAVAQTISYEVSLALILLSFIFLTQSYNLLDFSKSQEGLWFIWLTLPLAMMWFASCLAETNRTPFDFAEGESELVSGFNVEYSSGGFALIFMAEYASILFMSMLFVILFLGSNIFNIIFYVKLVFLAFAFIWVRGTLPRFRYDKLMFLAWKSFLPVALNYLIFFGGVLIYFL